MRSLACALGVLLLCTTRLALADSPVPAPPPLPLAELIRGAEGRDVRLLVNGEDIVVARARISAAGIALGPDDLRGASATPHSPYGWDRIDRIQTRRSSALRGALLGALVSGAIVGVAVSRSANTEGLGLMVIVPLEIAVGPVVGALLGANTRHWGTLWQRSPSTPGKAR
jgi:hypothetical protein